MSQVIVCGNLKGGVGKTTVAINLAAALAARSLAVAVLDLDPQGGASAWAASGRLPIPVEAAAPSDPRTDHRWLARAGGLASGADLVIVDLPPAIVPMLAAALVLADLLLVPVTPSAVDLPATEQTLRMVRMTRETRPAGRPRGLLVPNRVDPAGRYDQATQGAFERLAERWGPRIRQHTDHLNAFARGEWTGSYAPDSVATLDLLALADAVERVLGIAPRTAVARPAESVDHDRSAARTA